MKSINFVYGCRHPQNVGCRQYCYVKNKMYPTRGLSDNSFHKPILKLEVLQQALSQKSPEVFIGSIMGDYLSDTIMDQELDNVFDIINDHQRHVVMLLSKNSSRYAQYARSRSFPDNVYIGVTVEDNRFKYRVDDLRAVLQYTTANLWVMAEPILGFHDEVDYTDVKFINVCRLGTDQIYTDSTGRTFSDHFKEEWVESILLNDTVDNNIVEIYNGLKQSCNSSIISNHGNYSVYDLIKEKSLLQSLW